MAPKKQAQPKAAAAPKAKAQPKAAAKVDKAKKAAKVRKNTPFYLPKTLKLPRKPMYPRKSTPGRVTLDKFAIIKSPLTTEAAMKKIEELNTLVFLVDVRASKTQIRKAVSEMYDVTAAKINTLVRPDGKKKAYVKLTQNYDALDIANRIGVI